jgi:hypothetical protein
MLLSSSVLLLGIVAVIAVFSSAGGLQKQLSVSVNSETQLATTVAPCTIPNIDTAIADFDTPVSAGMVTNAQVSTLKMSVGSSASIGSLSTTKSMVSLLLKPALSAIPFGGVLSGMFSLMMNSVQDTSESQALTADQVTAVQNIATIVANGAVKEQALSTLKNNMLTFMCNYVRNKGDADEGTLLKANYQALITPIMTNFLQSSPAYYPVSALWTLPSLINLDLFALKQIGLLKGESSTKTLENMQYSMGIWKKAIAAYSPSYETSVDDYWSGVKKGTGVWGDSGTCSTIQFHTINRKAMGCATATMDGVSYSTTYTYWAWTTCTYQGLKKRFDCRNDCASIGNSDWTATPSPAPSKCSSSRRLLSGCHNDGKLDFNKPPSTLKTCLQNQWYTYGSVQNKKDTVDSIKTYITTPFDAVYADISSGSA